jgi:hypothetical protein
MGSVAIDEEPVNLQLLMQLFTVANIEQLAEVVNIASTGLATAVKMRTKIDLTDKMLPVGTKLPDINGEEVTGKKLRKRQTALVFSSVNCNQCDVMLAVGEEFNAEAKYKDQYNLVYIIFGEEADVADYAGSLGLTGTVVADPTGLIEKMFQVPFKPFMQCFEKGGALNYNAVHMDRSKTYGFLYGLLEEK